MTITISRKAIAVLAAISATIAAIGISGVAVAAWMSTGAGAASAKAATAQNSTIAAVAPISSNDVYPGATKTTQVLIDNKNPYPIIVTGISAGSSALVNSTCTAATVTSDAVSNAAGIAQSTTGNPVTIAAGGSGAYTLTTHMTATADNACQGQSFSLPLTATVQSNA